jgi:hypothetical protein
LVNPVKVHVLAGGVIVQVNPPGDDVTVKDVVGPEVAPSDASVTATVICLFPGDPEIAMVGIPGVTIAHWAKTVVFANNVTEAEFAYAVPVPFARVFQPLKVYPALV